MNTAFSTIALDLLAPVSRGREWRAQARKKEQQGGRKDADVSSMD